MDQISGSLSVSGSRNSFSNPLPPRTRPFFLTQFSLSFGGVFSRHAESTPLPQHQTRNRNHSSLFQDPQPPLPSQFFPPLDFPVPQYEFFKYLLPPTGPASCALYLQKKGPVSFFVYRLKYFFSERSPPAPTTPPRLLVRSPRITIANPAQSRGNWSLFFLGCFSDFSMYQVTVSPFSLLFLRSTECSSWSPSTGVWAVRFRVVEQLPHLPEEFLPVYTSF